MSQNARSQNARSQNARSQEVRSQNAGSQNASDSRSVNPTVAVSPQSTNKTATSVLSANADRTAMSVSEFNPFTTSLESNATRLMDEVFADLERMLERGVQLDFEEAEPQPTTRSQSKSQSKSLASRPTSDTSSETEKADRDTQEETDSPSSLAVLPKLSPRQLALEDLDNLDNLGDEADLLVQAAQTTSQPEGQSFDMLLISLLLASMTLAAGSWFFFRDRLPQPVAQSSPIPEKAVNPQDAAFLDYVQRSVERIDRAAQEQASAKGTTTSPTPTVLERVYIPIYQPPGAPSSTPASPATGAVPRVTVPASPVVPTSPPRTVVPPASQAAPAAPSSVPSPAPVPAPAAQNVLIGLLELGDRSAALFEINGATQRIQLGERIGDSGWTLVSISNQEAVIRRNGEVRSIYVGQQF
ncbi:MAG TPA: hypothetical protein V6C65_24270 [Allocoleopsis sp.]